MSLDGVTGPFRGLAPYEESHAAQFFGRAAEVAALVDQVTRAGVPTSALTGEPGVGKTSLCRAGLVPALAAKGTLALYLGAYDALEQALWQSAGRLGAEPPAAGEGAAEYVIRLARHAPGGVVLVLDHLEPLLDDSGAAALTGFGAFVRAVTADAGARLRLLICVEDGAFARLDRFHAATGVLPAPGAWMELSRIAEPQVTEIFEQTALQSGTFFEAGLPAVLARDLCAHGPALPLELQIVARMVLDLRLTSVRRYERSGGVELLVPQYLERLVKEGGGTPARRLLLELIARGAGSADELAGRAGLPRAATDRALAAFRAGALVVKRATTEGDFFALAHPRVAEHIGDLTALDQARARRVRRSLRRHILAGRRIPLREVRAVKKYMRTLTRDEQLVVTRSVRRGALQLALGAAVVLGLFVALGLSNRSSYTLALDPPADPVAGRVTVRLGRPGLSFLSFFPSSPRMGSIIADTGFHASGMAPDVVERLRKTRISGSLDTDRATGLPSWARALLDGLRPVPRGVTMVLLGDAAGIVSLKQAFSDPTQRREVLEALTRIGAGRAGEDEILAAALADPSPELRRRGVEVAAAIDRRLGQGSHATTLRTALADPAFDVRQTVLRECATLPPHEAGAVLAGAMADKDAGFRALAEKAVLRLAERSPAAAAEAVRPALRSADSQARRSALALLDQLAARAPEQITTALVELAGDEKAPEEARVAALSNLRRAGVALETLRPVLEKAVRPESSPRLRLAALPLWARIIDPAAAEALAAQESKGPPAQRASGAAIWGAVAAKQPEAAAKALKGLLYDPSPEVRAEAARSYGHLKREGVTLIEKALLDPQIEVARAALESTVPLAQAQPSVVGELLWRAFLSVRPAVRRSVVEAIGRLAHERPQVGLPVLVRALKQGTPGTREQVTQELCTLAKKNAAKNAATVSPYLRLAARDDDRGVRAAAAACVATLAETDAKGAAKLAAELAAAEEPNVRAAAAAALGGLVPRARDAVLGPLLKLLQDPDRGVRAAAAAALNSGAKAAGPLGKRGDEAEGALAGLLAKGDPDERRWAVRAAAELGLPGVLRQASGDSDDGVRLEVVRAAAALGAPGLPLLQAAVEDRAAAVRTEAIRRVASTQGADRQRVLPVFEAMLRSADPVTRRAGLLAIGDLADAGDEALRLLGEALRQPSEAMRTAAAEALGRLAVNQPERALERLEPALADPASDVRSAAIGGLATVWARTKKVEELARALEGAETDAAVRLVALQALVLASHNAEARPAVGRELARIAAAGPPLARLSAQIGRTFIGGDVTELRGFLQRLFGG